jgi:hypothetical protein
MAWQEKFENNTGKEQIVFCGTKKHRHEAALITQIAIALGRTYGGTWTVRANSYRVTDTCPPKAVTFDEIGLT